jgi:hypothetical protein
LISAGKSLQEIQVVIPALVPNIFNRLKRQIQKASVEKAGRKKPTVKKPAKKAATKKSAVAKA